MRRFVCAVVVCVAVVGVAVADEFSGIITKVDKDKVTFYKFDFKAKEKGNEMTLPVAKDVKVVEAKFNKDDKKIEAGDKIEKGLKNEMFTNIGDKGLFGYIVTDKDNKTITEIRVFQFKKKAGGGE